LTVVGLDFPAETALPPSPFRSSRSPATIARLGATVVTRNVREFAHIPGLKVENWQD
jgi:hypothetical protein